jgi:hypothetical protein
MTTGSDDDSSRASAVAELPAKTTAAAAAETARGSRERSARTAARRRELWGAGGPEGMRRLCRLFPALARLQLASDWTEGEGQLAPATEALLRIASGPGDDGERLCARFVLAVWNPRTDWQAVARKHRIIEPDDVLARFDVFEALRVWDSEHVQAMLTYLADPFWP